MQLRCKCGPDSCTTDKNLACLLCKVLTAPSLSFNWPQGLVPCQKTRRGAFVTWGIQVSQALDKLSLYWASTVKCFGIFHCICEWMHCLLSAWCSTPLFHLNSCHKLHLIEENRGYKMQKEDQIEGEGNGKVSHSTVLRSIRGETVKKKHVQKDCVSTFLSQPWLLSWRVCTLSKLPFPMLSNFSSVVFYRKIKTSQ